MEDFQKAYIAGIIDGEGSILLSRLNRGDEFRTPVVSVASTTREILDYLVALYGGTIVKHKKYAMHHRQSWSWRLTGRKAIQLCSDILPYLLVPEKIYRARLLVSTYLEVTPRNGKYNQERRIVKLAFEDLFFHPSTP